ncbi:MAG TPA: MFS transporter [Candidatus Binatia bacterium]|nr:MFS transporter [Candidatus Binatia bacterium]
MSYDSKSVTRAAWSPLHHRRFRALWIASVASNIGTWMHEVGAGWLMTTLTTSPFMVALMQTATSLPIFLLALPAGALADVVDRRKMLLFTQGWMLSAAALLGVLALLDFTTPWILLILTLVLGAGAAMNAPAWQATTPEIVPRTELPAAVALTGMGLNLARAVGPALGGAVVAAAGAGAVFLLNAVSFLSVMFVLYRWRRRAARNGPVPAEPVMSAIRAGIRYARHAPALLAVLVRTGLFVLFASALWALLPVLARYEMGLDSIGYGILFGCLGTGAVLGAMLLPQMRSRFSTDALVAGATVSFGAVIVAMAQVRHFGSLCVVMIAGGVAWIALMASFNVATQMAVPSWVRARALALYLLVFQGGMTAGSVLWGTVTEHAGVAAALWSAAGGLAIGLAAITRYPLKGDEELDLTPSTHWPEPIVVIEPHPDDGPVLVTMEYRIDPEQARDFTLAMKEVQQLRLRDGAFRWGLYRDSADPGRYVETFVVESWAEHLRQHERVTVSDRIAQDRAKVFHIGDAPPVISHYIYAQTPEMPNNSTASNERTL